MTKKIMATILTAITISGMVGCSPDVEASASGVLQTPKINFSNYETNEKFISFVDLPPDPNRSLDDYKGLGFSGFILTEDYLLLTQNGAMTGSYKDAVRRLNDNGLGVYVRNQYNDPYYFDTTAEGSAEYERNYTLDSRSLTDEFRENGGVAGFYMADEPTFNKISAFDPLIDWYNANYADSYFHMNLFPSYVGQAGLNGHTYEQYVQEYVDKIASKVKGRKSVCLDNYPFNRNDSIRASYLSDLLIAATKTKAYNDTAKAADKANMGLCIQTFYDGGLVDIRGSSDVSFQLLCGMAMGARTFEYFCYRSYIDGAIQLHGIFDSNMQKRVYDYVKEANEKYLGFEKVVNAFEWQGVNTLYASDETKIENEEAFSAISGLVLGNTGKLNLGGCRSKLDTLIGAFKKGDDYGYMVVNYSLPSAGKSNVVELAFNNATHAAVYSATENGVQSSVVTLADGKARITLGAGDGVFVIPV